MGKPALTVAVSDLSGPVERDVTLRASFLDLEPPEAEVHIAFSVVKCGREALVEGTVDASFPLPCSRCLEPARVDITERLNLSVKIRADGEIDLTGAVRDAFLVGTPMKVKCSPGCRGLCPRCGSNLNRDRCACDVRTKGGKGSLGVALDEALDRGEY